MKKKLDLETWPRKEHFNFFRDFDEPFFGVTVDIDCTAAYSRCKEKDYSFFLYYLHRMLTAANRIQPFRLRIEGDEVFEYETIHASPTVMRQDKTFGFSYITYTEDFEEFYEPAQREIERVKDNTDLSPATSNENVIHCSALPWLKFTSFSHARHFAIGDSCPKIAFGKMTESAGRKSMPVSVHVHHALVDGYHTGQFVEIFQELMDSN